MGKLFKKQKTGASSNRTCLSYFKMNHYLLPLKQDSFFEAAGEIAKIVKSSNQITLSKFNQVKLAALISLAT
jgi:hypothetical protein